MSECVCEGNWRRLVHKYDDFIGEIYRDPETGRKYFFKGLLHGEDDYYFAMTSVESGMPLLLSCVGTLTEDFIYVSHGFIKED